MNELRQQLLAETMAHHGVDIGLQAPGGIHQVDDVKGLAEPGCWIRQAGVGGQIRAPDVDDPVRCGQREIRQRRRATGGVDQYDGVFGQCEAAEDLT